MIPIVPHGQWRRLGLSPSFYLYLVLGIGLVFAAISGLALWRRPDLLPLFVEWYFPVGLIVFGIAIAGIVFAIWLEKRYL